MPVKGSPRPSGARKCTALAAQRHRESRACRLACGCAHRRGLGTQALHTGARRSVPRMTVGAPAAPRRGCHHGGHRARVAGAARDLRERAQGSPRRPRRPPRRIPPSPPLALRAASSAPEGDSRPSYARGRPPPRSPLAAPTRARAGWQAHEEQTQHLDELERMLDALTAQARRTPHAARRTPHAAPRPPPPARRTRPAAARPPAPPLPASAPLRDPLSLLPRHFLAPWDGLET